jgi:hypothetical protein
LRDGDGEKRRIIERRVHAGIIPGARETQRWNIPRNRAQEAFAKRVVLGCRK